MADMLYTMQGRKPSQDLMGNSAAMSALRRGTIGMNPLAPNKKQMGLEEEDYLGTSSYLGQCVFSPRSEKELIPGLYATSNKSHSTFLPAMASMSGLSPNVQGLSFQPTASRGLSNPAPFGISRSASTPGGFASMTGMTGVPNFGAPSPPPGRNSLFMNTVSSTGGMTQGLGATPNKPSRPNTLASAISSFPMSYGGLGSMRTGQIINPFTSGYGNAAGQLNKASENQQEFQMRGEDFPALPGSSTKNAETSELSQDSGFSTSVTTVSTESRSSLPYDPAPGSNKERVSSTTPIGPVKGSTRKGLQTVSIPPGMVQDQFGMMGLLTFIRGAETDPNLVALALGSDLTTLGLNLNSPENLYSTFSSPFADSPSRPQDIDYSVPQEYLIHSYIRDKLAPIRLSKYNEDLLFYLYYSSGGDLLQLLASHELYNREWRYHKEERIWLTRAPGLKLSKAEATFEEGTYFYFDVNSWRKAHKELRVEYEKLEDRPQIPPALSAQMVSSLSVNS